MVQIQRTNLKSQNIEDIRKQHEILIFNYAQTEKEIWGENYERVSFEEYCLIIEQENVYTAYFNDEVVGTVCALKESDGNYSFGLLAVDFRAKGHGIGRKLIETVENDAFSNGARFMRLEILKPENSSIPVKEQLANWYERLGYQFVYSMGFLELKKDKVEKAKLLITPSVFDCYEKKLISLSL